MKKFVENLRTSNNNKDGENSCIWQFLNFIKGRRDLYKDNHNVNEELDVIEYFLKNFAEYSQMIKEEKKKKAEFNKGIEHCE